MIYTRADISHYIAAASLPARDSLARALLNGAPGSSQRTAQPALRRAEAAAAAATVTGGMGGRPLRRGAILVPLVPAQRIQGPRAPVLPLLPLPGRRVTLRSRQEGDVTVAAGGRHYGLVCGELAPAPGRGRRRPVHCRCCRCLSAAGWSTVQKN